MLYSRSLALSRALSRSRCCCCGCCCCCRRDGTRSGSSSTVMSGRGRVPWTTQAGKERDGRGGRGKGPAHGWLAGPAADEASPPPGSASPPPPAASVDASSTPAPYCSTRRTPPARRPRRAGTRHHRAARRLGTSAAAGEHRRQVPGAGTCYACPPARDTWVLPPVSTVTREQCTRRPAIEFADYSHYILLVLPTA